MTSTYADRARTLRYDHPSSVKRREEDAAKPAPNPIGDLKRRQAAEVAELGQKHTRESIAFRNAPDRLGETRVERERKMQARQITERRALNERHAGEQRRAVEKEAKN